MNLLPLANLTRQRYRLEQLLCRGKTGFDPGMSVVQTRPQRVQPAARLNYPVARNFRSAPQCAELAGNLFHVDDGLPFRVCGVGRTYHSCLTGFSGERDDGLLQELIRNIVSRVSGEPFKESDRIPTRVLDLGKGGSAGRKPDKRDQHEFRGKPDPRAWPLVAVCGVKLFGHVMPAFIGVL